MNKSVFGICLVFVISVLLIAACTTPQPVSPTTAPSEEVSPTTAPVESESALDGKTLVEERCTTCHDLSRVEKPFTADEWKSIVERMIGKGATLSTEEKDAVLQYLSTTYAK